MKAFWAGRPGADGRSAPGGSGARPTLRSELLVLRGHSAMHIRNGAAAFCALPSVSCHDAPIAWSALPEFAMGIPGLARRSRLARMAPYHGVHRHIRCGGHACDDRWQPRYLLPDRLHPVIFYL